MVQHVTQQRCFSVLFHAQSETVHVKPQRFRKPSAKEMPSAKPSACFRVCGAVHMFKNHVPLPTKLVRTQKNAAHLYWWFGGTVVTLPLIVIGGLVGSSGGGFPCPAPTRPHPSPPVRRVSVEPTKVLATKCVSRCSSRCLTRWWVYKSDSHLNTSLI